MAKDIYHNGFSKRTIKTGARELAKGGIGYGVKLAEQGYRKSKILETVDNYNFNLDATKELGFMAVAEVGKEMVNLAFSDEKISGKQVLKSGKNVGLNLAEYGICKAGSHILI